MPKRPYVLLVATGRSPQVITETAFELYRREGRQPAEVHVLTTRVGAAHVRALLLGEEARSPVEGTLIEPAENRWSRFCKDVLGRGGPVEIALHVPESGPDAPVDDIRQRGDDTLFANQCYRLVEQLTRPEALPLVGSVAGGRKTMSAHLMTAFSVYARPDDLLTHVLLGDPEFERDPSFFYPKPGSPAYGQLLDLVRVRFPRLRPLLDADLLEDLPDDRRDLESILDALSPHLARYRTPGRISLSLTTDDPPRLSFTSGEEVLDTCTLAPNEAATFAVLADRLWDGEAVPATALCDDDLVQTQRTVIRRLCTAAVDPSPKPWTTPAQVSKAVSALRQSLVAAPIAERHILIEGVSTDPTRYQWPASEHVREAFAVDSKHLPDNWPFDHLPAPE
jgi:CRISPR-associated protein (TIGR02584 family)